MMEVEPKFPSDGSDEAHAGEREAWSSTRAALSALGRNPLAVVAPDGVLNAGVLRDSLESLTRAPGSVQLTIIDYDRVKTCASSMMTPSWLLVDEIRIAEAAGARSTLQALLVAVGLAGVVVLPPLLYLFRLTQTEQWSGASRPQAVARRSSR